MAKTKERKSGKEIRVGVVGYGGAYNMGRQHLKEMEAAGMVPTAVAELDPARRRVAEQEFPGIETYASAGEMMKKSAVDLVAIITPHNTHAKLALQCLRAGRHVVCEKPLAITTAECDAMIREAHRRRRVLSTYHNRHWDGCIIHAVKTVQGGAIGEIVRIEAHMGGYAQPSDWWRTSRSISGGILYDWGVHLLEYSFQLIPGPMTEVAGFAKIGFWAPKTAWKRDTNEDEGFAVIRFRSGQWLTLCITQLDAKSKNADRKMVEITGTKGSLCFNNQEWELITPRGAAKVVTTGATPENEGWRFYQNVADHLTRGAKLVITPEWSRRPIHVLDLAVRSAKEGRALKVTHP